ncbi:MAG: hypothetical protein GXP39_13730 [Chloroflexi bacterium]|nr:hypothetical protein [Chloroflexota bacterium]
MLSWARRRWARWEPVALFLLALAIRLWRLTYHSLWFDESVSAYWASRPASEIVRVGLELVRDKHPPVYYLLLRGWTLLFGTGDAAVRSLGVLLGALGVFPVYALGRRWGGRAAGAVAALLFVLNPFLVWYSQEARMFMPAATFALFGFWGLVRATEDMNGRGWIVFGVMSLAGVYAYLFNALLLPAAGIWWLMALARRWRSGDGRGTRWLAVTGVLAMAGVAIGFLPLAWQAWFVSGVESTPGRAFADAGITLRRFSRAFLIHRAPLDALGDVAVLAGAAALVALVMQGLRGPSRDRKGVGELLVILVVPWLIGNILLARNQATFAETRYWLFLVPFLCLGWGLSIVRLIRRRTPGTLLLGGTFLAVLLAANLAALPWDWRPETRREDWRAAARYIEAHEGPNDAILIHVDYVRTAFLRYYRGKLPVYFPFGGRLDDMAQVAPPLEGMSGFDTIWLVESHLENVDDDRLVERWLGERYPLVTEQFPAGVVIRAYAVRRFLPDLPSGVRPLEETLAPGLTLAGCRLSETTVTARDDIYHPPSGWVHVALYWRRSGDPPVDARPRLHLVDGLGQIWGAGLERPQGMWAMYPPDTWPGDAVVRDEHDVNLNPITPPGEYRMLVAVVGPDGEPLGPEVPCGSVRVVESQ